MNLNNEQRAVVESNAERIICLASPGSGKTRCLVERVRKLVSLGVDQSRCVLMAYTNAAADEIQSRLGDIELGFIGTLHAFLLRLLGDYHETVGLPSTLSVIDDEARLPLIESIAKDMGIKVSANKALELVGNHGEHKGGSLGKEELLAMEYRRRLHASGLLDFDGILRHGLRLVQLLGTDLPYTHLFVDEIQDASELDWQIYMAMACPSKFLTGDSDQAIFGWRGGNVANIVGLAARYSTPATVLASVEASFDAPEAGIYLKDAWAVYTLEINHRSNQGICLAADRLIEHNKVRFDKRTLALRSGGDVTVHQCENPAHELALVLKEVSEPIWNTALSLASPLQLVIDSAETKTVGEIYNTWVGYAVLARTNALADSIATYLEASGVPVRRPVVPDLPPDWQTAKLLLTVLANPYNDLAVHQLLVKKDGKDTADAVRNRAESNMRSMHEHLGFPFQLRQNTDMEANLTRFGLSPESRERIHDACREMKNQAWTLPEMVLHLAANERAGHEEGEGVHVGTIHGAKSREWATVIVVGCEEGNLPSLRKDTDIEEERRLMFVAATRAKDRLVLTWCKERPQSRGSNVPPGPMEPRDRSRFLAEMGL